VSAKEDRALIFRMVAENPTWGAPRIHGELLKLGFDISERSSSRWIRRAPRDLDPVNRWLTFLRNHRVAIAVMGFFTVPTLTFGVLYRFFVVDHDRRKILHFQVTRNPHSIWVIQQLREARAYKQPYRFLLFDRDAKFGAEVVSAVRGMGSHPTRTPFAGQNGVAER
jgi:putative transposase